VAPELADLWDRVRAFDIDGEPRALSFAARLARENGWAAGYAARVVVEYKRFALLAATGAEPVTPSDQVDQAWHLHLTYTRSYWDRFCAVLGVPLHHEPTKGGPAEGAKFDEQYRATLARYRAVFGADPPADIWPPAAVRFGDDLHFVRVNTRRYRVFPRLRTLLRAVLPLVLLAALAPAAEAAPPKLTPPSAATTASASRSRSARARSWCRCYSWRCGCGSTTEQEPTRPRGRCRRSHCTTWRTSRAARGARRKPRSRDSCATATCGTTNRRGGCTSRPRSTRPNTRLNP
jgi:hypothetical protein